MPFFRPALESLEERLAFTTHTWTGTNSTLWSDPGNWLGGSPAGDPVADLVFPAGGVTNFISTDNLAGITPINSITFIGNGFTVNANPGNSITLAVLGITGSNPAGTNTVALPIALVGIQTWSVSGGTLAVTGALSGGGGITKTNAGELVLAGNNAYSGGTNLGQVTLVGGTLTIGNSNALGTGGLNLLNGLLQANGTFTVPNPFTATFATAGFPNIGGSQNLTLSGPGTLNGTLFMSNTAGTITLPGNIGGPQGLVVNGPGETVLSGNNSFANSVSLGGGTLTLGSNTAPGTGVMSLANGLLRSTTALTFPNAYDIGSGLLTIGGSNDITFTGSGMMFNDLTVATSATLALSGPLSGNGNVRMQGTGMLILGGNNPFLGNTIISGGIVLVNGTDTNSPVQMSAGILGGTGFVNGITATGGRISPGTPTAIGTLASANATLNASTTLAIKLQTTMGGNVSDKLAISGNANLGGSTLLVLPQAGFLSPVGDTYTLVGEFGTGTITGTFANASPFSIPNNGQFQLAYSATATTLTHINTPPALSGVTVTSPIFETQTATLSGTITDPDPLDTFTLQINWGDGSAVQTVNLPAQTTTFSVPHPYQRESNPTYAISLTLSDGHPGSMATAGATITVQDRMQSVAAVAVAAVERQPFNGVVATFQDAVDGPATDFSAKIDWGDGSSTAGAIAKTGPGQLQVNGNHAYADEGSFTVTVTVQDKDGTIVTRTSTATVTDAPLNATGTNFSATAGQPLGSGPGGVVVATFTDTGGPELVANYSATIDWGDGTPTTSGNITLSGPVFSVAGNHVYANNNTYVVRVSILDKGGASVTATGSAQIGGQLTLRQAFAVCGIEGRPLLNVSLVDINDTGRSAPDSTYRAVVNWGDGTAPTLGTVVFSGVRTMGGTLQGVFSVTASHTYAAEGTYSVTVTVSRAGAGPLTFSTTAKIGGFITSLYRDVLGRVPDAPGLAFWVQQSHAGISRVPIAQFFWQSPEHRGIEVDQFYGTFFGRSADPAGRATWVNALVNGASESAVVAAFVTSPEYTTTHASALAYVNGLYQSILRRNGENLGLSLWTNLLQTGARSRADVALAFLRMEEAYLQAINDYYEAFLGRPADAFGQRDFLTALSSGRATPASITAVFLSSDEHFARVLAQACQ